MALFGRGGGIFVRGLKAIRASLTGKTEGPEQTRESKERRIGSFLKDNPGVVRTDLSPDTDVALRLTQDFSRSADFVSGIIARNRQRAAAAQRGIRSNILTSPLGLARNNGGRTA